MQVVVLGAGYAGLTLTRALEERLPEDVSIVLVDERDTHLVQHLLHRVIRRPELADELRIPLSSVLSRAEHRRTRVEAVDAEAGKATLADGELDWDVGAVCLGARPNYRGVPGVEEYGTPLKRPDHAAQIRAEFLSLVDNGGRAVVGGAGLAGIQVAGELAALRREEGAENVEVHLVEQAERVAPTFPERFHSAIAAALRERDVVVETARAVERAETDRLVLSDGTDLPYDQLVWTGGIAGRAVLGGDRPRVRARLRLGERTFGLGDAVRVVDADGAAVPASAKTALDQAEVAATNVARLVAHYRASGQGFEPRLEAYRDGSDAWLVTVGDGAVGLVGPTVVTGRSARAIKSTVGARYFRSLGVTSDFPARVREALRGEV